MDDWATRMEVIETKVAFQEDLLQQLHDALVAQQTRIDQLEGMLRILVERQSAGDGDSPALPEPPPPHF
jgi:uncharacterized coiled-coil protein SlyX